jgi:hypothetical protein
MMAQATASTTNDELRSIVVELARTELAAVGSALKFWGDWVASADKYTQQLRAELDKADQGGETSKQFVGKLADLTREYLREVIALPAAAVEHFNNEVEKNASAAPAAAPAKRKRRARAKE